MVTLYLETGDKWSTTGVYYGTCLFINWSLSMIWRWGAHACQVSRHHSGGRSWHVQGQGCHPQSPGRSGGRGQQKPNEIQHIWTGVEPGYPGKWFSPSSQSLLDPVLLPAWGRCWEIQASLPDVHQDGQSWSTFPLRRDWKTKACSAFQGMASRGT